MDLDQIFATLNKMDSKLDNLDFKLDTHSERISAVEVQSANNAGMIKLALTGIITIVTSVVVYSWNSVFRR